MAGISGLRSLAQALLECKPDWLHRGCVWVDQYRLADGGWRCQLSAIIGLGLLGWAAQLTMSEHVLADCWNRLVPEITGLMPGGSNIRSICNKWRTTCR